MKDRKRRGFLVSWTVLFWAILLLLFLSGFTFSSLRLFFREGSRPRLVSTWRTSAMKATSGETTPVPAPISIQETIIFPDQALVFLKHAPSAQLFAKDDIDCIYMMVNSSEPRLKLPPLSVGDRYSGHHFVRCPVQQRGMIISIALKPNGGLLPGPMLRWDSLVYEAIIDRDNTTVIFVKGLNLRSGRISDPSKFRCLYGWDFRKPKFVLLSDVVSVAQEIVRCRTPSSILSSPQKFVNDSIKVSVRVVGRRTLGTMARIKQGFGLESAQQKQYKTCVCTMLRNQGRFLREWIMYHAEIGVERWFLYDNNSEDDIDDVIVSLVGANYNVTRHVWPWIKTQEAGFAHCALRARDSCEWVGFIDVDEFFHLPSGLSLSDVLNNQSSNSNVAELRVPCHNFGPSGLKKVPVKGVTVGYTCRLAIPERHKSIVRPEALNSTLINVVHHFHLKSGFRFANMNKSVLVINHYKYQVWEVFKEKFYRRVATYVSDWQQARNVGSKDRTPGLGTKAVEPRDWSTRFCEVRDNGLRDRILKTFTDPKTGWLPWQEQPEDDENNSRKRSSRVIL